MRLSIVVNPYGGGGRGRTLLAQCLPILASGGAEVVIAETTGPGHASTLARDMALSDVDGLVVIGGDGTLSEVVNGMLSRRDGQRTPLGILPGGSGNAVCHDLGRLDIEIALQSILRGESMPIDAIRIETQNPSGDRYAVNIVGWGLVTDIGQTAQRARFLGKSRYTLATFYNILNYRRRAADIELDDKTLTDEFAFVIACNTIHTGKGMKIAPRARLTDGLMDVIVVRGQASRGRLLRLFPKLFDGKHIDDPHCEYHQVRRCAILPKVDGPLNRDGDIKGKTPVRLEVVPKAFSVFGTME